MTLAIVDGDVLIYRCMWGKETIEEAQEAFKVLFEKSTKGMFMEDYVMALGGPDNFRLDLFAEYKGNRKKAKETRPLWFDDLKSWVVDYYDGAIFSDNCEADDMVRVWATEAEKAGIDFVVVSIDKDLHCIVGKHMSPSSKGGLGILRYIDAEYAERFYWQQVLTGDSTDNIPGIYRCGPVKAKKILADAVTHEELRAATCKAYYDAHGEEGYSHLLANGRLIHIWRHIDDYFKISKEVYNAAIS